MYGGRHAFLRAAEVYVPFVLLYFRFCTFNVKTFCVPFLKDALEKATSWEYRVLLNKKRRSSCLVFTWNSGWYHHKKMSKKKLSRSWVLKSFWIWKVSLLPSLKWQHFSRVGCSSIANSRKCSKLYSICFKSRREVEDAVYFSSPTGNSHENPFNGDFCHRSFPLMLSKLRNFKSIHSLKFGEETYLFNKLAKAYFRGGASTQT